MTRPFLPLILFLLLILGCSQEDNQTADSPDDSNQGVDTTPPVPTIIGLEVDLEVATTIDVSIEETSAIEEISVSVNQSEILNTTEKTFSFELNPFDYPNGENLLTITAQDSEGNQSVEDRKFIVNKLLVSVASPTLIANGRVFITANKMTGELITIEEVLRDFEIVKLYANDNFTEQPIIITSYIIPGENNLLFSEIKSIANIEPGTDLVKFQENARAFTENTNNPNTVFDSFSFQVKDVGSERVASALYGDTAIGLGEFLDVATRDVNEETSGFTSNLEGRISDASKFDNIFVHTTNSILDLSFEPIKMEDYKYLMIDYPTEPSVSFTQFNSPDNIGIIGLPNTMQSVFISVNGFKNQVAFNNQNFSSVYTAFLEEVDALEIPLIGDFDLIISDVSFPINFFSRMSASIVGAKNIEIPNWTATRNQESIDMIGDFDVFKLSTSKNFQNGDRIVSWEFIHNKQQTVNLNMQAFEFPENIKTLSEISQIDLELIKTPDFESITLIGSTGSLDYKELLFDSQNGIPRPYNGNPVDIYVLTTRLSSN